MIINFLDEEYKIKEYYVCESFSEAKKVIEFANKVMRYSHMEFKPDSFHREKDIRRWYELKKLEIENANKHI